MATNTTKNIKPQETSEQELSAQVKEAAAKLNEVGKVKVSIPKALEKHIGPTLPLGINGVMIVLPVNGKEYEVPVPFAALLKDYINNLQL